MKRKTAPQEEHRHAAPAKLGFFIVTVSSSRYDKGQKGVPFTDESGDTAEQIVERSGHELAGRELISDDVKMIRETFERATAKHGVDVVAFLGGTGVSPRDVTVEAVRPMLEKEITGFGEVLRGISFAKMGTPALLTRSTAGVAHGKLILLLPGSPDGVKTAMELFMTEMGHVVYLTRK